MNWASLFPWNRLLGGKRRPFARAASAASSLMTMSRSLLKRGRDGAGETAGVCGGRHLCTRGVGGEPANNGLSVWSVSQTGRRDSDPTAGAGRRRSHRPNRRACRVGNVLARRVEVEAGELSARADAKLPEVGERGAARLVPRELRPRLALAVRERGIDSGQGLPSTG